jgi:hypothetical protein
MSTSLASVYERLNEAIKGGATAEAAVAATMRGLNERALKLLVKEYLLGFAESIERNRERSVRRDATVKPKPQRAPVSAELREQWAAEDAASDQRFRDRLASLVSDYTQAIKVEWTAELMATTFGLPDGRRTTWADATVEDHTAHITMMGGQVRGMVEDIAMHEHAISTITAAGAATLAEAVGVLA